MDHIGQNVLNPVGEYAGNINSYAFAHDMDIENSFFAFKQYFLTNLVDLLVYLIHHTVIVKVHKNTG